MKKRVGRPKGTTGPKPDPIVAERIKNIRKKHNYKQIEFAEKINEIIGWDTPYDQKTISNWETAKTKPNYEALMAISERFDVPLSDLMNLDGKEQELLDWSKKALKEMYPHAKKKRILSDLLKLDGVNLDMEISGYHLLDVTDYLLGILKQSVNLMDPNISRDDFILTTVQNAQKNYDKLENQRLLELGYRENKYYQKKDELKTLELSAQEKQYLKDEKQKQDDDSNVRKHFYWGSK